MKEHEDRLTFRIRNSLGNIVEKANCSELQGCAANARDESQMLVVRPIGRSNGPKQSLMT